MTIFQHYSFRALKDNITFNFQRRRTSNACQSLIKQFIYFKRLQFHFAIICSYAFSCSVNNQTVDNANWSKKMKTIEKSSYCRFFSNLKFYCSSMTDARNINMSKFNDLQYQKKKKKKKKKKYEMILLDYKIK